MAWLRIDDAAMINHKLGSLTDREFRALVALWAYCARSKNGGKFSLSDLDFSTYYSGRKQCRTLSGDIKKYLHLGLVDHLEDGKNTYQVHDWHEFQPTDPTAAERMKRYRNSLRQRQEGAERDTETP